MIFNLGGLAKVLYGVGIVPLPETDAVCQVFNYFEALRNIAFRLSISAFLLWRIKQIELKRSDMYIGFSLFAMTTIIQVHKSVICYW